MKNNIPTIFKDERVPLVVADNKKNTIKDYYGGTDF